MTNTTSKLVIAFFTMLLGIVLIGTIADSGSLHTNKFTVNETLDIGPAVVGTSSATSEINESVNLTLANAPTGWKVADCPITSFSMYNQSGSVLTVTTDYILTASAGTLSLTNTTALNQSSSNDTQVSYTYCGDDYLNLTWGRSIMNLVAGFFALAILGISLGLFYSVAKDAGLIGR